jgi:PhnB protein
MSAKDQTLRAHMTVHDAKEAITFYAKAFGATELFRLTEPSGKVGHAEIRIGDSVLMLNDEYPDFGAKSPTATGGSPVASISRCRTPTRRSTVPSRRAPR